MPHVCPECAHPHGAESITRGSWLWKFTKPLLLRCCHTEIEQDALVDTSSVCNCANQWHTDSGEEARIQTPHASTVA